jgi:ribosomal protein S18 acetylase RimI-like enzyme
MDAVVRDWRPGDARSAAALHARELPEHFLTGAGPLFLRRYQRAFARRPGLALVVCDDDGEVRALLLGCALAGEFYSSLLRHDGAALGLRLVLAAVRHPSWGLRLLRSRARRYLRALWSRRPGARRPGRIPGAPSAYRPVGEVTILVVDRGARRQGLGQALLTAARQRAVEAGAVGMELVAASDDPRAAAFYRGQGWSDEGPVSSASGEQFRRYTWRLPR